MVIPTTAVVAGAVAVGAVASANGATLGSATMVLQSTDAKAVERAGSATPVSRSTVRASVAVDSKVKAAVDARAKAKRAATARAGALRAAAKKKAVLAAINTATPARDHVESAARTTTGTGLVPGQGGASAPTPSARATAAEAAPSAGAGQGGAGYLCPIAGCGGTFTSGYGFRVSPGGIGSTDHGGIDLSTPIGTPLRAMRAGTVVEAGWYGGCGMRVVVDYGNGVSSWYCHLSGFAAAPGQQVGAGQVVAWSGNSGNSTGPHLHLEIHLNGTRINPYSWLVARGLL